MNLESEIMREHSRRQASKIAEWVGSDSARFEALMKVFLNGERRVTQRAAWSVSICAERHPALAVPWLKEMIRKMQQEGVHDAVIRNGLRIMQFVDIPRRLQGSVADICFGYLASPDAPIAARAFSMTVLERIAAKEPELKRELKLVIEQLLPYSGPGIRARARKILKKM